MRTSIRGMAINHAEYEIRRHSICVFPIPPGTLLPQAPLTHPHPKKEDVCAVLCTQQNGNETTFLYSNDTDTDRERFERFWSRSRVCHRGETDYPGITQHMVLRRFVQTTLFTFMLQSRTGPPVFHFCACKTNNANRLCDRTGQITALRYDNCKSKLDKQKPRKNVYNVISYHFCLSCLAYFSKLT